jgi:CRP/FNR family transcriptional regulator
MKEILKEICLFGSLDDKQLDELAKISTIKKLSPGNIIFYEGDEAKNLYFLIDGLVKLYKYNANNQISILNYYHTPSILGESATLQKTLHETNAECDTKSTVLTVPFEKFEEKFLKDPEVALGIIMQLVAKLKGLMNVKLQHTSTQKVAQLIYENSELFTKLKKYKIAEILNMTPETLSRTLKKIQKDKIIKYTTTSLEILDRQALGELFLGCSIDEENA